MKKNLILIVFLFAGLMTMEAGNRNSSEIPLIGSAAPAFTAETTDGTLQFPGDFGKSWKILFSHPGDFTPVCTHEIMHLAKMQERFKSLDVKIAVVSTDSKEAHLHWKLSMEEIMNKGREPVKIRFPLIDDSKVMISKLYGMLHEPVSTTKDVRGVFIISPENLVEATFFYPMSVGRNMDEILRTVQALQIAKTSKLYTPTNWNPGDDLLVPYHPYTDKELSENPDLLREFYNVGSFLWYKKAGFPGN